MEAVPDEVEVLHAEEVVEVVGRHSVLGTAVGQTAVGHSLLLAAVRVVVAEGHAVPHVADGGSALLAGGQVVQDLKRMPFRRQGDTHIGLGDGVEVAETLDALLVGVLQSGTALFQLLVGSLGGGERDQAEGHHETMHPVKGEE